MIIVADQLWVVRAGRQARYVTDFRRGSFIAVSFEEFFPDDLTRISEESLRARVSNRAERSRAIQLSLFAYRLHLGDYVIVPLLPKHRSYLVGQVTGPYQHITPSLPSGPHRRQVKWLGEFPRDSLSGPAKSTMGSIQTIFRPIAAEAELRELIADLKPLSRHVTATLRLPSAETVQNHPCGEHAQATLPAAVTRWCPDPARLDRIRLRADPRVTMPLQACRTSFTQTSEIYMIRRARVYQQCDFALLVTYRAKPG